MDWKPEPATLKIDPKYEIRSVCTFDHIGDVIRPEISIVKTTTGVPIPIDEPLILFRARDKFAVDLLKAYYLMCRADHCTPYHMEGISNRIAEFERFRNEHPERMKQPGSTSGL